MKENIINVMKTNPKQVFFVTFKTLEHSFANFFLLNFYQSFKCLHESLLLMQL